MKAAVDVYYDGAIASSAAVLFEAWSDKAPLRCYTRASTIQHDYLPGRFYVRELAPIASVLQTIRQGLRCVIIDGYVDFGPDRPALGHK